MDSNNLDSAYHLAEVVALRLSDPLEIAEHTRELSETERDQVRMFLDDILVEVGESVGRQYL